MKYLTFFLVGIIFVSNTCSNKNDKDCHTSITIFNNSDKAIYFHISPAYSDTLILDFNPTEANKDFKIEKFSSKKDIFRSCIEGKFYNSSEIRYFIYDAQILDSTPWDTIVNNYMILKRFDLSLEDLQKMNWTISYL